MKTFGWFKEEYAKISATDESILHEMEIHITEQIVRLLEMNAMKKTELAKKLGISESAISELLDDGSNLTLKKLVAIAQALNGELQINLFEKDYNQKK